MSIIALDPVAKNMVMYDILNEPDSKGIGWEGAGSGRSMTDNYLAVMDQVRTTSSTLRKDDIITQDVWERADNWRSMTDKYLVVRDQVCLIRVTLHNDDVIT